HRLHALLTISLSYPLFFYLLFFQCSADPRDLHSFPTRRSSDLCARRTRSSRCSLSPASAPATSSAGVAARWCCAGRPPASSTPRDRKSTRLNSSHVAISYAVFCLKKKKQKNIKSTPRQNLHKLY